MSLSSNCFSTLNRLPLRIGALGAFNVHFSLAFAGVYNLLLQAADLPPAALGSNRASVAVEVGMRGGTGS